MIATEDLAINETTYQRCVRAFSFLHKRLGLNVELHQAEGTAEAGQIFLFNHFARFETIVPQYLLFKETGAYCRTLASQEFFANNDGFANFLLSIGGVPNNMDGLLPFLAAEILRGRKVVVFPEGGMIKDRRVVDEAGELNVFSPSARARRKHHKGAAAVALMLEIFKKRILSVHAAGDMRRLDRWVEALGLQGVDELLVAAGRPTSIVPGNITFFPIRVEENILQRGVEVFFRGLGKEMKEELLIEGNILLKDTDMDIRFGDPIEADVIWKWWERLLLDWAFAHVDSLDHLFDLNACPDKWVGRLAKSRVGNNTRRLRDRCMAEMYRQVTVNVSHFASRLMLRLAERRLSPVDHDFFHRALYLAVKFAQDRPVLNLHRSLSRPAYYAGLPDGRCEALDQLVALASRAGLLKDEGGQYHFLPKLSQGHGFHEVRLENPVQVYANEIAAIPDACEAVDLAIEQAALMDRPSFAKLLFDDERRALAESRARYSQDHHLEINDKETATESGEPYLLTPTRSRELGILLVHGLLASPAELRPLGDILHSRDYPVMGVRLKGHGTSPWDLRDRAWREWLASVERGYEIISAFADRVCIVGFSLGGNLALRLAAEGPSNLAGVAAVASPMKLRNKNLVFVPVIHGANKLAEWTWSLEGVMPFRLNDSEHPETNYRHIPIRALYELRRSIDDLDRRLGDVTCPVAILHGNEDRVADPKSAKIIYEKVSSSDKTLDWIEAERHGILRNDIGGSVQKVLSFIESLRSEDPAEEGRQWQVPVSQSSASTKDRGAVVYQGEG